MTPPEFSARKPTPRHITQLVPVDEHTGIDVNLYPGSNLHDVTIVIATTDGQYEIKLLRDGELARRIARGIAPGVVREGE